MENTNVEEDDEIAIIEPVISKTTDDQTESEIPKETTPNMSRRTDSISNGKRRKSEGASSTSSESSASRSSRSGSSHSSDHSDNGSCSFLMNNIRSDTNAIC